MKVMIIHIGIGHEVRTESERVHSSDAMGQAAPINRPPFAPHAEYARSHFRVCALDHFCFDRGVR
jgi:hypothetical protein